MNPCVIYLVGSKSYLCNKQRNLWIYPIKMRYGIGWTVFLCAVCCVLPMIGECSLATMSIDLGSQHLKMGLVKQGSTMEIVLNKESRRKTPSIIGLRKNERFFSDSASQLSVRYADSVFMHLIDVIGKDEGHPLIQLYRQRFPHSPLTASSNGSLFFPDGDKMYSTESILAMLIQNAKLETEAFADQQVEDVVIAIPAYYSQRERITVRRAAEAAGLKVLQLIHAPTAAALSYGAFHRKDIDGKTTRMMVYDMGASQTTATIVEFYPNEKKEMRMKVLGTGYNRRVGGLEFTIRLRDHLAKRWIKETEGASKEVVNNARSMAKLLAEAERVKQVLSANSEIVSQIESLHEEKNLRLKVTRDELEGLIKDTEGSIVQPVDDALKMSGVDLADIKDVVLMGGASRMPFVQRSLQSRVNRELGRFLNTDEATAMGSLFQSAHLSKGFKVKPLPVEETLIFPVEAVFSSPDPSGEIKERHSPLFPLLSVFPSSHPRSISFKSFRSDFSFIVSHAQLNHLSPLQQSDLGTTILFEVNVKEVERADNEMKEGDKWKEIKVGFSIDASGIVRSTSAQAFLERPRGTIEALTDSITGIFAKKKDDEEGNGEEKKEENGKKEEKKEGEENKKEEGKKEGEKEGKGEKEDKGTNGTVRANSYVKVKDGVLRVKLDLLTKREDGTNVEDADVKETAKVLSQFLSMERARLLRAAAENELEATSFDSSLLLDEEYFIKASTESERKSIAKLVEDIRSWLEDVNESTETNEFTKRTKEINKAVGLVKKRIEERKKAPGLLKNLKELIAKAREIYSKMEREDETITKELKTTIEGMEEWIKEVDREVKESEDLPYTSMIVKLKEDRLKETAKTVKRKIEKKRKEEEKKKKEEEKEEEKSEGKGEEKAEETKGEQDKEDKKTEL